jgi:hypothetical protein
MENNPCGIVSVQTLIALLLGIVIGAAGKYYAEWGTEQRRRKAADVAGRKTFGNLQRLIPGLIAAMAADVRRDPTGLVREFVVLPSKGVMFSHSKRRFRYDGTSYRDLPNMIDRLRTAGFISLVKQCDADCAIYRMGEEFVELLKTT